MRAGTEKKSLISPGGLPLITIVSYRSDGVTHMLDAQVTYVLMNGALVAAGNANGGTNYDPSLHAAMLDPMWTPDAGSQGLLPIYSALDYREVNGELVNRWDYPGKHWGYPWLWWEYDYEPELFPDSGLFGIETLSSNDGIDLELI